MKLRGLPMLQDVTSDLQMKNPQINLEIDRNRAACLGISAEQIENTLYSAYGSRQATTIYSPTNQYKVIMELEPQYQMDPAALGMLYVRSDAGQLVPLSSLVTLTKRAGAAVGQPSRADHLRDRSPSTSNRDVPLGDAVTAIEKEAQKPAGGHNHRFPGDGPGVSGLDQRAGAAAAPGHSRHLHRAGDSLRELHPSADDPLRTAVRRFRRADYPAASSARI